MSSDPIYLAEATKARKEGNLQGALAELLELLDPRSDSSSARHEAWLEHFVGRFADRENERPLGGGVCFAANILWDACRQAATQDGHQNWFEVCDMAKIEQVMLRVAPAEEKTQSLVSGSVEVVRAACALAREKDDSYTSFPMHFADAAMHFAAFWNARSSDAKRIADLQPVAIEPSPRTADLRSEAWLAWVRESTTATVTNLQQEWLYSVPGMCVPIGLAMAEHALLWVCGIDLPIERDRMTTIVFAGEKPDGGDFGVFVHLRVQRHGEPSNVFYPDPVALGLMSLDAEWTASFDDAARFIERHSKEPLGRCSWSLRFPWQGDVVGTSREAKKRQQRVIRLEGGSASAAAACALHALAENKPMDIGSCVTARVAEDGTLRFVGGRVAKILGLPDPRPADSAERHREFQSETGSDDFVEALGNFIHRLLTPAPSEWLSQAAKKRNVHIEQVDHVGHAMDWVSDRLRAFLTYLEGLSVLGLQQNIHFLPDERLRNLMSFLLPVRVITLEEWQQIERSRPTRPDDPYSLPTESTLTHSGRDLLRELDGNATRTVLVGGPGEGKTTALWMHLHVRCQRLITALRNGCLAMDDKHCRIPAVLPLIAVPEPSTEHRATAKDNRLQLVDRALDYSLHIAFQWPEEHSALQAWMKSKCVRSEFELMLDGLDELAPRRHDALRAELLRLRDVPILLTTRPTVRNIEIVPQAKQLYLCRFGPKQQKDFIHRYFANTRLGTASANELLDRIDVSAGPRQLASVPLLLSLLCWRKHRYPDKEIPHTRTELLGSGLYAFLNRGDNKRGVDRGLQEFPNRNRGKEDILRHVAWEFFTDGPRPLDEQSLSNILQAHLPLTADKHYLPVIDASDLLGELLQDGILVPSGPYQYRFVLRCMHEYCVAGWVSRTPILLENVQSSDAQRKFDAMIRGRTHDWRSSTGSVLKMWPDRKPLNAPSWRNVWPLLAGQMDCEWLVESIWNEHLYNEDILLSRLQLAAMVAAETPNLSQQRRLELIQALTDRLRSGDLPTTVLWLCADSLAQMTDDDARRAVVDGALLQEVRDDVRSAYVRALRLVGGERSRQVASTILADPDASANVRDSAAYALGCMGGRQAHESLQAQVTGGATGPLTRSQCVRWLGLVGDEHACAILVSLLRDPKMDTATRCASAREIGRLGDDDARDAVLEHVFTDEAPMTIRRACAYAVALSGVREARDSLLVKLVDKGSSLETRQVCAFGLGFSLDDSCRDALIAVLQASGEDVILRSECADALGRMGDEVSRASVLQAAAHPNSPQSFRVRCHEALGKFGRGTETAALIRWLQKTTSRTPIGRAREVAHALGRIGSEAAREALIDALHNATLPLTVRSACASGLSYIGDPRARDVLVDAIQTPDLRDGCFRALHDTIERTGWRPLLQGDWDPP